MLYQRLRKGIPLEEAVIQDRRPHGEKAIHYDGKDYSSMTALAKAYGVSSSALRYRLRVGKSLDEAVKPPKGSTSPEPELEEDSELEPNFDMGMSM